MLVGNLEMETIVYALKLWFGGRLSFQLLKLEIIPFDRINMEDASPGDFFQDWEFPKDEKLKLPSL